MLKWITGAGLTLTELQSSTAGDEALHQVLGFVCSQRPPKKQVPSDLSSYYHIRDELHIEEGCLVPDCQFVPPSGLRKLILGLAHSGHPRVTRMKRLLQETYWWPGLSTQVHDMVSQCQGCQFSEKTTPPSPVPAISVPKLSCPWSKVGIDIAGPFADAPTNQKYIMTVTD